MFCPKCGQNQLNDAVRFCSRCGFQLSVVSGLLATGGEPAAERRARTTESRAQRIKSRFGAKLVFLSLFLLPFAFLASFAFDSPVPFLMPLILTMIGIAQVVYLEVFGDLGITRKRETDEFEPTNAPASLPPPRYEPIPATGIRATDTAEMVQPPSVTEPTTILLHRPDGRDSDELTA
jgi:hypothetical protein